MDGIDGYELIKVIKTFNRKEVEYELGYIFSRFTK